MPASTINSKRQEEQEPQQQHQPPHQQHQQQQQTRLQQQQGVADQAARALLRDQAQDLRGQRLGASHSVVLTGELRVVYSVLRIHA